MPPKSNTSETQKVRAPWLPTAYDIADAGGLQALQRGDATPDQQKRTLDFVIVQLCGTYEQTFYPGADGQRNSDFAQGRRTVGLEIVKLLNLALSRVRD